MNEDTTPNNVPAASPQGAAEAKPQEAAAPMTPPPTLQPVSGAVATSAPKPPAPAATTPPPSPSPMQPTTSPFLETGTSSTGEPHSFGPAIGAGIVIVVIALGGLYFWGSKIAGENDAAMNAEQIRNQPDPSLTQLQAQSSSDEVGSIEQDLNATDLENIDAELNAIEQELQ